MDLIRKAQLHARDMRPYSDVLFNAAKFFNAGEHIDILEIGVRRGASTRAFLKGLKERIGTGHLYSIDKDDRRRVIRENKENWTFLLGYSSTPPTRDGYEHGEVEWDKEIDIFFLDGDHSYEVAKADYFKYEPFVKEGGLIMMHDVTYSRFGVRFLWKAINYPKAILPFNNSGLGIINKI